MISLTRFAVVKLSLLPNASMMPCGTGPSLAVLKNMVIFGGSGVNFVVWFCFLMCLV